jgi:predicted O-methyltransferase YrrM
MRNDQPKSYEYIEKLAPKENALKIKARENSAKIGLEKISISPTEAMLIKFILKTFKPVKMVEIGTLTGLSALYFLEAIEKNTDYFLWTLEKSEQHAALAKEVLHEYIEAKKCEIVLGDAKENLKKIQQRGPFDAVFIDGNKAAYLDYFNWAAENVKSGGIIIADNVFLAGAVWGDATLQRFNDKQVAAVQKMNELAFDENKFESILIPTTEGLLICKKL